MTTNFTRNMDGFIPEYKLTELAKRLNLTHLMKTNLQTQELWTGSAARDAQLFRFGQGSGTGARWIYDAKSRTARPGVLARKEGDAATKDAIVNDGYDFHGIVRDYYRDVHGRNSIDANGMALKGIVHYGSGYNNAFWDSQYMTYGDGDNIIFSTFMLLNVAAHELGHGVTEHAVPGGIEYYGQAGAINEHLSDVSGANVESWYMNKSSATMASNYHWLVGKGIWMPAPKGSNGVRRALRDMLNPGTAYNDRQLGKDRQPADMAHFYQTNADNGGVHINSGILNRAYALFARGIEEHGLGADWDSTIGKAAHIWYAARPNLGNRPAFGQLAYWTIEACSIVDPVNADKLVDILKDSFNTVGVVPGKNATDTLTPPVEDADAGNDL